MDDPRIPRQDDKAFGIPYNRLRGKAMARVLKRHAIIKGKSKKHTKALLFRMISQLESKIPGADKQNTHSHLIRGERLQRQLEQPLDENDDESGYDSMLSAHLSNMKLEPTRRCCIFYEIRPLRSFPSSNWTPECSHGSAICSECLTRCVDGQLEDGRAKVVYCPLCDIPAERPDIQRVASKTAFERYVQTVNDSHTQ